MEATSEITGGCLQNYTEGPSGCQPEIAMSTADDISQTLLTRPKRADARRNYEKVLTAAREAFAEGGESTALEEIARRAGVGIGTLYRHFPNRQALLEALYVDEVEEICRTAAQLEGDDPWEALNTWFERFIGYIATKQALAAELLNYVDRDAQLFRASRAALWNAGEPLLQRAQEAGVVRPDVGIGEVIQMVMGIAKIPTGDPRQTQHILRIALDGLRYRPDA
jgi:AcrR family transcriptional regulator